MSNCSTYICSGAIAIAVAGSGSGIAACAASTALWRSTAWRGSRASTPSTSAANAATVV